MQSLDLIRDNVVKSRDRVLARAEEMRAHGVVFPTPRGGDARGGQPAAGWEELFDGPDTSGDAGWFPPFDDVLAKCRETRESTLLRDVVGGVSSSTCR